MTQLIMTSSGIRGIVGDNLDPSIALQVGKSMGIYLDDGPVIVGGDTRLSYEVYKTAVISGLLATGRQVIEIGQVPTPTCQQMIRHHSARGGIVITASHNPQEWNGLKLLNGSGSFLTQDEFIAYKKIYDTKELDLSQWDKTGTVIQETQALDKHIDKILAALDTSAITASKLKVLIDPNNGTGCYATPKLLDRLGVSYDVLNGDGTKPFSHTPEPSKANVGQIMDAMTTGDYDIGFVQDPDADRLVMIDENGRFIGEDVSLGLCVDYILQSDPQEPRHVVVNLSTSRVIEDIAKTYNAKTIYTKIGETHVTQGIKEQSALVGGEGNGGVIYPKIGWGRDSLTGIVIALKYLAESKKSVSEIVSQYPSYVLLRHKTNVSSTDDINTYLEKIKAIFPNERINTSDGVKIEFDNSWIHLRPSNTEPIIRLFIEAPTQKEAEALYEKVSL